MRIAIALALILITAPAMAQRKPAITGRPIEDIKTDLGIPQSKIATSTSIPSAGVIDIGKKLQTITKDVLDAAVTDLSAASADAASHNDQISQPCWDAQVSFIKSLPAEQQNPPTTIGPALAIQISRDLRETLAGNEKTSLKVACAALLGDELNILNQFLGAVGVGALTGLPVGL